MSNIPYWTEHTHDSSGNKCSICGETMQKKIITDGLYQVTAQIIRGVGGWASSVGVPTFYVTADTAQEAVRKAKLVLNPFGTDKVSGTVIKDDTRDNYLAF